MQEGYRAENVVLLLLSSKGKAFQKKAKTIVLKATDLKSRLLSLLSNPLKNRTFSFGGKRITVCV